MINAGATALALFLCENCDKDATFMTRISGAGNKKIGDTVHEVIEMNNYPYQQWSNPYTQRVTQQWYQPPQPQPMQPAQPAQAVMVTSRTEAEAAQIPFDPAVVSVFVDLAHGAVYIKRFNQQTGGADLEVYNRQTAPEEDPVGDQIADLVRRVEALEARRGGKKEATE